MKKGFINGLVVEITEYLALGGLFNPELAYHMKVRDLLISCRDEIERLEGELADGGVVETQDQKSSSVFEAATGDLPATPSVKQHYCRYSRPDGTLSNHCVECGLPDNGF